MIGDHESLVRNMKTSFFVISALLAAVSILAPPAWGGCPGEGVAMNAGRAFTAAAQTGSASAFLNAANRFADVRAISISALGPHRNKLTKGQEEEYLRLARIFMGQFMAKHAGRFNTAGMKVVSCSETTVTATANSGRKIIFRVAGGRVRDVNVSSIWLAGQMRAKFVGLINRNNGNVEALLDYLRS
jgi:ABC-type transporter MlaC component